MATDLQSSIGAAKRQLRDRIIRTYQRAERIVGAASISPSAKTHGMMIAYDKAREHLRSDLAQAGKLLPDTDALVLWLLEDLPDDVMPEQDRIELALVVRTLGKEVAEGRKASLAACLAETTQSRGLHL
jgi:hypothetical protein